MNWALRHLSLILFATTIPAAAQAQAIRSCGADSDIKSDCSPCRFSPGRNQPDLFVRFVTRKTTATEILQRIEVAREPTGPALQVLAPSGNDVDMCAVVVGDISFDGFADLGVTSAAGMVNSRHDYFLYRPGGLFEAVGNFPTLHVDAGRKLLTSFVRGGYAGGAFERTTYAVFGNRIAKSLEEIQDIDPERQYFVRKVTDYTQGAPKLVATIKVLAPRMSGTAIWLADLKARHARALVQFRTRSAAAALLELEPAFADTDVAYLYEDDAAKQIVPALNDLGLFYEQVSNYERAVAVLKEVTAAAPTRAGAWLVLGDALYGQARTKNEAAARDAARDAYRRYVDLMTKAGQAAQIPARVKERL